MFGGQNSWGLNFLRESTNFGVAKSGAQQIVGVKILLGSNKNVMSTINVGPEHVLNKVKKLK